MRRYEFPFQGRRYIYDYNTRLLHDVFNEKPECKIDEIDTETLEAYSSLHESSFLLEHPYPQYCPHCFGEVKDE